MAFTVYKSQADKVTADFPAAVEAYRQALLAHRFSPPARQYAPAIKAIPPIPAIPPTPARGKIPGKRGRPGFAGRPGRPEIPASPGEARPTSHPLIEACIVRVQQANGPDDFVADYVIVDDTVEQAGQ